jgi:Flp pilus assembly protein TadD
VLSAETGEVLAAQRETANDSTELVPAVDRLSKRLREKIGESLKTVRAGGPLDRVTTPSLAALRKHSQALRAYSVEGDLPKAVALWEEAIALDTTFAAAYRGLGVSLFNTISQRARAVDALAKAFRYRDQLTDRERYETESVYYIAVTAEYEKAAAACRALLDAYPDDQSVLIRLGAAYSGLRDYARAERAFRRAIEVDSTRSSTAYSNVLHFQIIFGRLAQAETTLARARAKFSANPKFEFHAAALAVGRGDYAGAEARWRGDAFQQDADWRADASVALASLAVLRGELRAAEEHLADAQSLAEQSGAAEDALRRAVLAAYLDVWFRRAPERAVKTMEAALRRHPLAKMQPLDRPYLLLASVYAVAGRPAQARALITEYEGIDIKLRRRQEPARRHRAQRRACAGGGRRAAPGRL